MTGFLMCSPLRLWMDLTRSICCHRPRRRRCSLARRAPKENGASSFLQSNGKPSRFAQSPWNVPPTWPPDGNSGEEEQSCLLVLCFTELTTTRKAKFCSDLESQNQVAELEHSLQVEPDADPVNPCRPQGRKLTALPLNMNLFVLRSIKLTNVLERKLTQRLKGTGSGQNHQNVL